MSRDHPGKKESHCEGMPHTQDVHTNAFHWSCWSSPPRLKEKGREGETKCSWSGRPGSDRLCGGLREAR